MAENSDYSDEEDRDDCDNNFEKSSSTIKDDDLVKITENPIIHPQPELFLSRRLSGLPLMYPSNGTSKIVFDDKAAKEFNSLLDRFPKPPDDSDITATIIPGSGNNSVSSSKLNTGNSWGSLKGFAEKFYNFSKN
eukprot:gene26903-35600_t